MLPVPRHVRKQNDPAERPESSQPLELTDFRAEHAWVLLGEPGAGKSTALKNEAEQTGGQYLRIDEFINLDPDPSWQGKTLFLDGLDEVRASGTGTSLLQQLRKQLGRLGRPAFRIACRAADWNGAADRDELKAATPDGKISILSLEPLSENDILTILQHNPEVPDSTAFVASAKALGVADLLTNPQTLAMLAKAIRGNDRPGSRDETYRLACETLAQEHNPKHRRAKRDMPVLVDQILDAAGQLCAVMLLADRTGVATELAGASERFPVLEEFSPPDPTSARQAIGSKLFRPDDIEERLQPVHRSVAEYLAARWLGKQIDDKGLPLPRLLTLLLGADGGVVAGLRGLFAWLAVHCLSVRQRLIEADPLTVVIYGDVKPMSPADKRAILQGLRREAEKFSGFRGHLGEAHRFGALADPALIEDFRLILQAPERDEASQAMVDCVLDVLDRSDLTEFAPPVLRVVRDDSMRGWLRRKALDVWVMWAHSEEAMCLLEDIHQRHVKDDEGELAAILLMDLYPGTLEAKDLLRFLRIPGHESYIGNYYFFWTRRFPECIRDEDLPVFLDGLIGRTDLQHETTFSSFLTGRLITRALESCGTSVSAERLYSWLGLTSDGVGHVPMDQESRGSVANWFKTHPERYKDVLAEHYRRCAKNLPQSLYAEPNALNGMPEPEDIGLWHFTQATQATHDEIIQEHLRHAINSLQYGKGNAGLKLEGIEDWACQDPQRLSLLQPLLSWEIPDWRRQQAERRISRANNHAESRRQRLIEIAQHLPEIEKGTATANVMYHLACVWNGRFADISGETPLERFSKFIENSAEILSKAETGFRRCPERDDLPEPQAIIDLYLAQKDPSIGLSCRIGMELRWQGGVEQIDVLTDATLDSMLTLWLTLGEGVPKWVKHLAKERPPLFSQSLVRYAESVFKAGRDLIDGIQVLEDSDNQIAARLTLPKLLEIFPARAREGQVNTLGRLLKLALRLVPEELARLCDTKLQNVKKLDVYQAVLWHAAAMLLDPAKADPLWAFVGKTSKRSECLADFLRRRFGLPNLDQALPATITSKLIELIAPHAEMEWTKTTRFLSDANARGDQVRRYIERLGATDDVTARAEIERLLALPSLKKLKWYLENARHQQAIRQRESSFRFPTLREAAEVLANGAPTSHADLAALVLDHLDQIAYEIQHENDDGYASFWNVVNKKPVSHREENRCRDELLRRLRARLDRLGISCEPEADYVRDKRADIQISYRNEFKLPIEIKGYWHEELWTALRSQLIAQYTTAPLANGFGVYLILWFGRDDAVPQDENGKKLASICMRNESGKKPSSPQELQQRLTEQLDSTERDRVFVRVLDVSWH